MVKSFIVRNAAELKAAGATVLAAAFSSELVRRGLGGLEKRKRVFDAFTTWLIFLGAKQGQSTRSSHDFLTCPLCSINAVRPHKIACSVPQFTSIYHSIVSPDYPDSFGIGQPAS
jgi:hypothetical protein